MTTLELLNYYTNLLIKQYKGKPKAIATIEAIVAPILMPQTTTQQISFSENPTSGAFELSYDGSVTTSLNSNATDSDIQSALQALPALGSVTVLDALVTFTGVIPPALSLGIGSNSLSSSGKAVIVTITETDLTLPLAVQNAYNLTVEPYAEGVQLDVLGKYAGVTRTGNGVNGQSITLDDSDFLSFIQMAIVTNSAGSSLYDIVGLLNSFFPGEIYVYDYAEMRMSYLISSTLGSTNLIQLFITEGLLPKPMGVQLSVIYTPIIDGFFGFVTYQSPTQPSQTRPFNTYENYNMNWPWLAYEDGIIA